MAIELSALLDCPACGVTFEGFWSDDSLSLQDMAEVPVSTQVCPNGHVSDQEYPKWTFFTEAG